MAVWQHWMNSGKFQIELPSSMDCLRQMAQGLKYIRMNSASGSFSTSGMKDSINFMEILSVDENRKRRATSASDVFSLGCVFYVFLSEETHPVPLSTRTVTAPSLYFYGRQVFHEIFSGNTGIFTDFLKEVAAALPDFLKIKNDKIGHQLHSFRSNW